MSILVVGAHPDDEVLGAGGTIARARSAGIDVSVLLLGDGATSRAASPSEADPADVEERRLASIDAAARLGVAEPTLAGFPDNRFDGLDLLELVKAIEAVVSTVRPTTVLTHHVGDLNVDHQLTARAVLTATRPQPGCSVRHVLSFEVVSATNWSFGSASSFEPSVFVDIGATLGSKLEALEAYAGEMRPAPHARSVEAVKALAAYRGSTVGVDAAEAFQLIRSIR